MKPEWADIGTRIAVAIVVVGYFGVLIGRLLIADFSDAQGEMVRWTITTVLTAGGALIGLNWYQNQQRYERDKREIEESAKEYRKGVDTSISSLRDQLTVIERRGHQTQSFAIMQSQRFIKADLNEKVYRFHLSQRLTVGVRSSYLELLTGFQELSIHQDPDTCFAFLQATLLFLQGDGRIDLQELPDMYRIHMQIRRFLRERTSYLAEHFTEIDAMVDGPNYFKSRPEETSSDWWNAPPDIVFTDGIG